MKYSSPKPGVPILVVENDPERADLDREKLEYLKYRPLIAVGQGMELVEAAVALARRYYPPVAIVDMRLGDDSDPSDLLGLDLIAALWPTRVIIRTAFSDEETQRVALRYRRAFDFIGKEDKPERLWRSVSEALQMYCPCGQLVGPHWHRAGSHGVWDSPAATGGDLAAWCHHHDGPTISAELERLLYLIDGWKRDQPDEALPLDELYEVRLRPDDAAGAPLHVTLDSGDALALPEPLAWTARMSAAGCIPTVRPTLGHRALAREEIRADERGRLLVPHARSAGLHHSLADAVTLELEVLLALAPGDGTLSRPWYELLLALVAPASPDEPLRPSQVIVRDIDARKVLAAASALRGSRQRAGVFARQEEYLWGMLLECVRRMDARVDPLHPLLPAFAGLICLRLTNGDSWPPPALPVPRWIEPATYGGAAVRHLFQSIRVGESRVVAGHPLMRRQRLLQQFLVRPDVLQHHLGHIASQVVLVPVNGERMIEVTEHYLYELLLTALTDAWERRSGSAETAERLRGLQRETILTGNGLLSQRNLEHAISLLCREQRLNLCLLLDRFDRAYTGLPSHALAALTAIHDQHWGQVSFVLGLRDQPGRVLSAGANSFFDGLFVPPVIWQPVDDEEETRRWFDELSDRSGWIPAGSVRQELIRLSGGQAGLLQALFSGARHADGQLGDNHTAWAVAVPGVAEECGRIWNLLADDEQQRLSALARGEAALERNPAHEALLGKGLIVDAATGQAIFSPVFADFVARQPIYALLRIDSRGRVMLGERPLELTSYGYKIIRYLYDHPGELCTAEALRTQALEADADIPHLILELRRRIEPEPRRPRYLVSRPSFGYQLFGTDRFPEFRAS